VENVRNELNDFFKGKDFHRYGNENLGVQLSHDHVGVIHRNHSNTYLQMNKLDSDEDDIDVRWSYNLCEKYLKSEEKKEDEYNLKLSEDARDFEVKENNENFYTGLHEVFGKLKDSCETKQPLLIRDDFAWYHANGRITIAGKPILFSESNPEIHPMFFGGIVDVTNSKPGSINLIEIDSKEQVPFKNGYGVFYETINILRAIDERDYFIKLVENCELKRSLMSKGVQTH